MTNKEYSALRDLLIPKAKQYADSVAPKPKIGCKNAVRDTWVDAWNLAFHEKMNELAKERGLMD